MLTDAGSWSMTISAGPFSRLGRPFIGATCDCPTVFGGGIRDRRAIIPVNLHHTEQAATEGKMWKARLDTHNFQSSIQQLPLFVPVLGWRPEEQFLSSCYRRPCIQKGFHNCRREQRQP